MPNDLISLIDCITAINSTLDKSTGKKNLIDGNIETCWTSQQGIPQSIQLHFSDSVEPKRVSLIFQGGFVATRCSIQVLTFMDSTKEWRLLTEIYPQDVNRRQTFDLQPGVPDIRFEEGIRVMKFVFEESSDFFGRITIYDLGIEGTIKETTV